VKARETEQIISKKPIWSDSGSNQSEVRSRSFLGCFPTFNPSTTPNNVPPPRTESSLKTIRQSSVEHASVFGSESTKEALSGVSTTAAASATAATIPSS